MNGGRAPVRPLVYLGIKFHPDHRNRRLVERIGDALELAGASSYCVARDLEQWGAHRFDPEELMHHSFRAIERSDLVLIELTEKGVGLGVEAGFACARHIPVAVIHQRQSDPGDTIRGVAVAVEHYDFASLNEVIGRILGSTDQSAPSR